MSKAITTFHSAYAGSMYPDAETDEYDYVRYADHAAALRERDERIVELENDIAVLATAFHEVLADNHSDDSTFQQRKKEYIVAAMQENKFIEAFLPHFLKISGMEAK